MVSRSFFALCDVERSPVQCDYDFNIISQTEILDILVAAQKEVPDDVTGMSFPARRITFPVVLDDRWNREALERYMATIRKKAVYLPSNIDYLARKQRALERYRNVGEDGCFRLGTFSVLCVPRLTVHEGDRLLSESGFI